MHPSHPPTSHRIAAALLVLAATLGAAACDRRSSDPKLPTTGAPGAAPATAPTADGGASAAMPR